MRWIFLGVLLCLGCGSGSGSETAGSGGGGSGGSGGSGGNGGGGALQGQCEALCDKQATCSGGQGVPPDCAATCVADFACLRDEYMAAFVQCYVDENPECQTSYDSCQEDAIVGLQMRPVDMAYLEACSARRMECMNAWPTDSCYSTPARESCVAEAQACLEKPCGEVKACILAAFNLN